MQQSGTSCTDWSDFAEEAGSLTVTNAVDVGVDYIVPPDQDVSLELTGPAPTYLDVDGLLSSGRIMVIDCGGACGVSAPSNGLSSPEGTRVSTWSGLAPLSYYEDKASRDAANPVDPDRVLPTFMPEAALGYQEPYEGKYCAGHNLAIGAKKRGLDEYEHQVPMNGLMRPVAAYGCHAKCSKPFEGEDCFCDGYFSGYDSVSSNALCADADTCKYLCDNLAECSSIDRHKELNRCFLNVDGCTFHPDALANDGSYQLLVKRADEDDHDHDRPVPNVVELPPLDVGFSWNRLLRFAPVRFASGGTFKLCFCYPALLAAGRQCRALRDFSVEVGTIHASGVSCLIGNAKLRRASCVEQFHGGLRCYQGDAPEQPPPPILVASPTGGGGGAGDAVLQTYCSYLPEEVRADTPGCPAT